MMTCCLLFPENAMRACFEGKQMRVKALLTLTLRLRETAPAGWFSLAKPAYLQPKARDCAKKDPDSVSGSKCGSAQGKTATGLEAEPGSPAPQNPYEW
jgi:hypothetical protein